MADYNQKIEQLKKDLLQTSNLRNIGRSGSSRKKQRTYGFDSPSRSGKYQPARVIECTQNVVELRKLINDWSKLEKAKKASLNRMQHEKWALEEQYSRILGENVDSDLQESFQLEPGFRFKANGDLKKPKKPEVTKVIDYIKNWNALRRDLKNDEIDHENMECRGTNFTGMSAPSSADPILGVANENSLPYFGSQSSREKFENKKFYSRKEKLENSKDKDERPTKDTDSVLGTVNVTKTIEETEKALKDIYEGKELKDLRARGQCSKASGTFLRATSKENRYSGGPDAVRSNIEMSKAWALKNSTTSLTKRDSRKGFKDNCAACEFNLSSGHKDACLEKKLEQLRRPLKRWQSVWINQPKSGLSLDVFVPGQNERHGAARRAGSASPSTKAVKSAVSRNRSKKRINGPSKSATSKSTIGKVRSPVKLTQNEIKPTSVPNVLKVEVKRKKSDPVTYTKSTTDYVDQRAWDENDLDESREDCLNGEDEDTPVTREKLVSIASLLLEHSPGAIPKGTVARGVKYTEPLYHRMIARNSITNKESLQILQEIDPEALINRHLNNVEILTRGLQISQREDDDYDENTRRDDNHDIDRDGINERKRILEALKKNMRKSASRNGAKARKSTVSSATALRELAEMERKESEVKINHFLQTLPPPEVSIERWRANDGVNKSVFEVYAPNPRAMDNYLRDLDYEKDPFVMNPDLLLKEIEECKLLTQDDVESLNPVRKYSSHV